MKFVTDHSTVPIARSPLTPLPRVAKLLRLFHWLVLAVLYGLLTLKTFVYFQESFDFMAYHLPWALRMFNLTSLVPDKILRDIMDGYPHLAEFAQGLLVWITGSPTAAQGASLLAFGIALASILFVFGTSFPMRWFLTFIFAVPALVLHLTIGYTDLFVASTLLLAFSGLCGLYLSERPHLSSILFTIGMIATMETKMTGWIIAPGLALSGVAFAWRAMRKGRLTSRWFIAFLLILSMGITFHPVRNMILYRNPTYPLSFGYPSLTRPSNPVLNDYVPPYLRDSNRAVLFIHSAFELNRLYAKTPMRWTYDQYDANDDHNMRMGGWFFLTTATLLFLLFASLFTRAIPWPILVAYICSIALVPFVSWSHMLRYFLFLPLAAIFLFCLFMQRYQRHIRYLGIALLTSCVVIVLVNLGPHLFSVSFRPPAFYASPEVKEFWNAHLGKTVQAPIPIPTGNPQQYLYRAGPTFNEIPVIAAPAQ